MRRELGSAILAGTALLLAAAPARADNLPDQTLQSTGQVVTWHGANPDPTGQGYGPPAEQTCTPSTCDSFVLHVNMPPGSFPKGPKHPAPPDITRTNAEGPTDMPGDGVLISIKWATDFDQWNIYVDDMSTGQTVAQGIDVDSNAQSVLLSQPHNGDYRVTIVPFYTDFDKADLRYRGEARAFLDPTQRYAQKTTLLPKIRTMAPSNFHIGDVPPIPSNPTGWRYTPNGTFPTSCYADETAQFGSTRCLRFDNNIRNVGNGPLVLRFDYSPQAFAGNCNMLQEVLSSDGSVTDRGAGPCVFHPQHAHFHYQNMGRYQLYHVDSQGRPAAAPSAASNKVGFCTIDVDDYEFGQAASLQRPRTYSFPTCNIPNAYSTQLPQTGYGPSGPPEYMGISPGWGDVYTWDLPQQYIDISNVPDGVYEVVSKSNFDAGILTSDRSQETGVSCIAIQGSSVKVLQEMPSQSDSAPLPDCRAGLGLPSIKMPSARRCLGKGRLTFRLHHAPHARVVRVAILVNGKRKLLARGHDLRRITIRRLPRSRRVRVRVVATQNTGSRLVSTRIYHGCHKSRPHTRRHRRRG